MPRAPKREPVAEPQGQAGEIPDGATLTVLPSASGAIRVIARWPIMYQGRQHDRGAVFALAGLPNDERLLRLGYVEPFKGKRGAECGACGTEFADEHLRALHGNKRHRDRFERTPQEEDQAEDREERMLQEAAPLRLDRTAAALA